MNEKKPTLTQKKLTEKQRREERLAEALRANLRRRKAQTRVRKEAEQSEKED